MPPNPSPATEIDSGSQSATDTQTDPEVEQLAQEIASLRSQVAVLSNALKIQTTTLLSSPVTASALLQPSSRSRTHPLRERLSRRLESQKALDQQSTYRLAGGGVTSFPMRDPDPNAVDGGRILGLRFEIMSDAQFRRPYFVFLNRPFGRKDGGRRGDDADPRSRYLRVHRHTIPACMPLGGMAARYLPPPPREESSLLSPDTLPGQAQMPRQDLVGFARAVRCAIVAHNNRIGFIAGLQKAAQEWRRAQGTPDTAESEASHMGGGISDVFATDPEAKQISIQWEDGRSGRAVLGDDGAVQKMVVVDGAGGRDWATAMADGMSAGEPSVEGLLKMLGIREGGKA